jgi:sulfur-carrier protein
MPHLVFAAALQRHVRTPELRIAAATLKEALEAAFKDHPRLRPYVLDDQGHLRRHVALYLNGEPVRGRGALEKAVRAEDEIHIFQALSGG